jgi:hypothetical protein
MNFFPYPSMTVFSGEHPCHAGIARACTGVSARRVYRLSVGKREYSDLCERCERTFRRRYLREMRAAYDDVMEGNTPLVRMVG